ncbi:phosphatidylglycerophosphatase A [Solirhodobacter olei]|uniref:phosphatidylglycerophosphatase A family protein n=1 Tax=Solirhodobacter olei TaxID=2493082 RepID=UPI000FD781E3|nr:phosphatidylglycerophosphatase A [Solirhodobacter olei]
MTGGVSRMLATVFGVGYLRPASGTWASALAVVLAMGLHGVGGFPLLLVATLLVTALGFAVVKADLATRAPGDTDPSEIVIDEVAGQWIAMCAPSAGFWFAGLPNWDMPWPGPLTAFIAFRLFDVWKPWIVGRADARGDAAGVMLDDIYAGIMAAVVVIVAAGIAHGIFHA